MLFTAAALPVGCYEENERKVIVAYKVRWSP